MDSNTEQQAQSSRSLCEEVAPPTSHNMSDETERALPGANSTDECDEWIESAKYYQDKLEPHYSLLMCGNITNAGPTQTHSEYTKDSKILSGRENLKHQCVLPKGHPGKCCHHFNGIFKKTDIANKVKTKSDTAIYKTPGNDDIVFKNRASRLFGTVLSTREQKKIRDKQVKKSCAIPLQDASTPFHLLCAYLDYMVFIVNIKGIEKLLDTSAPHYETIMNMLSIHKQHLIDGFAPRKIFDDEGYTMCVITQVRSRLEDFCDPTRDMRTDCRDTDIQLGHVECRSDRVVSIRGENLLPMSRRGNLIIGEHNFMKNTWIEELTRLIQLHN